jgi:hypothetical protein
MATIGQGAKDHLLETGRGAEDQLLETGRGDAVTLEGLNILFRATRPVTPAIRSVSRPMA